MIILITVVMVAVVSYVWYRKGYTKGYQEGWEDAGGDNIPPEDLNY